MNCTNCGAENDADARFCGECGSPLEDQAVEAAKANQAIEEASDPEMTIISTPNDLASEAKTVSVDQDQVAAALEDAADSTPEPESASPPPETAPSDSGNGGLDSSGKTTDDGNNRRQWIIIGVIVIVVLLCCCCSLIIGSTMASPEIYEDILRELDISSTMLRLPFV